MQSKHGNRYMSATQTASTTSRRAAIRVMPVRHIAGLLRSGYNAVFCFVRAAKAILARGRMNTLTTAPHESGNGSAALCSRPSPDRYANQWWKNMPAPPASSTCAINDDYCLSHPWPIGGYRCVDRLR